MQDANVLFQRFEMCTLVFTYFMGHSTKEGWSTKVVLNECSSNEFGRILYPMEDQLRSIARIKGTYVISVFDCFCEEVESTRRSQLRDSNSVRSMESFIDLTVYNMGMDNFLGTFGYKTNLVEGADSIALCYFQNFRQMAQVQDGSGKLRLPIESHKYRNGVDLEFKNLPKVEQYVYLNWNDKSAQESESGIFCSSDSSHLNESDISPTKSICGKCKKLTNHLQILKRFPYNNHLNRFSFTISDTNELKTLGPGACIVANDKYLMIPDKTIEWIDSKWLNRKIDKEIGSGQCIDEIWLEGVQCSAIIFNQLWQTLMTRVK